MTDLFQPFAGDDELAEAFAAWWDGRPARQRTERCRKMALKVVARMMSEHGRDYALRAVEHSAAAGYRGIFPDPALRTQASGGRNAPAPQVSGGRPPAAEPAWAKTKRLEAQLAHLRHQEAALESRYGLQHKFNREQHPEAFQKWQGLRAEIRDLERRIFEANRLA